MSEQLNFQGSSADRLPPQNIEAEEAILGGILLDPEAISRVTDKLITDAFYIKAHRDIYQAALRLSGQGKPTDLLSITSWLNDHDLLAKIGGKNKLVSLVERTVSAVNIDALAQLVMDKYQRRLLIKAGNEIVQLGFETETELPQILDKAEQKVFSIAQERSVTGLVHIGDSLINNFTDIEERNQGIALPGISSGFYDLDAIINGGFQRSDLIIIAGRPAMGKCVAFDTEILMADGSVSTIEEIYQSRQAQLLSLGNDWRFYQTQPSAYVDDGIKPVFRVKTRLGKYVETTITHPYLTINGWRKLSELKVGDKIAVPRRLDVFGTEIMRDSEIKILAYLIGDGCLTGISPQFTNNNPLLQEDFSQAVTNFVGLKVRLETSNWLRELDIWGKNAHTKSIPKVIFRLTRSQIALFLNRLFATDGWASVLKTGQAQLGYCTVSEKLARQIQHLLLRFGVIATLKERSVKYKDTRRKAWQLDITDAYSIKTFVSEIGIFGKEKAISQVELTLEARVYQTNYDTIPVEIWEQLASVKGNEPWATLARRAGIKSYSNIHVGKRTLSRERLWKLATEEDNLPLQQLADSDIYWDEIVSIESMGEKQVYDLTIPNTHNFIANDICVHNTSFAINIAHYIAGSMRMPVAIFSLEMSKEQLALRMLSSEAKIESTYLKSGRISQNQWEDLTRGISSLQDMPIYIDDTPNITVTEMRSQARRLQAETGVDLGLVLIDYLQLMEGGGDNRVQELSKITRNIKGLARELHVPVIALSQLSRGVEARTNKRPMLSDLRESGSIEQDADLVMMLYRDEYYSPDTPERGIAEAIVAKHRHGPTGTIKLLFDPQFTQFKNLARSNY
ncbi:replicative DNA helicase [Brunnivagina elsteri]|uniref:Replicative DNA helicase n=1 Tax=Brunnivagina elsteri CCALA 953 TaxID=987040 RepID=A0A2A2TJX9_9CYAN|nr:replicative DNA helicase [Calothrix elsteri]PAX55851.1 replicative DNA helicase [Calothrix elsteri CCALA 953]